MRMTIQSHAGGYPGLGVPALLQMKLVDGLIRDGAALQDADVEVSRLLQHAAGAAAQCWQRA